MKNKDVEKISKALGLERCIIGLQFLYFQHEYDKQEVEEYGRKTSYCMMVKYAMDGKRFKAKLEHFACRCAIEALGLEDEMECVESGQRYYSLNLYESRSVAKAVTKDIPRIKQKIYGIALGPLESMDDADLVLLMANPYQLMRIVQGYSYKWGIPKNISMAGNQGVCADLTAGVFERNDLNFSVLCAGTRKMCSWKDTEMGVGLPIQLFSPLVEGVIQTMNYIDYPKQKAEIRKRLSNPMELGVEVDDSLHYGQLGKPYVRPDSYKKLVNGEPE